MNQPTPIKDLIAGATPGPHGLDYDNADDRSGGQWYKVGPAEFWWPYAAGKEVGERARNDAMLYQRLSPEVVLAVVEALEHAMLWIGFKDLPHATEQAKARNYENMKKGEGKILRALELLDGGGAITAATEDRK